MICQQLGQHQCSFAAKTSGNVATKTRSVLPPLKIASVSQSLQDQNLLCHVHSQHSWQFRLFIKANTDHPPLAPFGGGLEGVCKPLFINGQAIVLRIRMPVATTIETTTPSHVIIQFGQICNKSIWLMWFLASCDMMMSDYEGNNDDDLVKQKSSMPSMQSQQ